ncbi:MAG TPA: hypothetical protein VJ570_07255 [Holophagaceae bacterium]|nr:hypothetical protein [Holophagaceae bacterium]
MSSVQGLKQVAIPPSRPEPPKPQPVRAEAGETARDERAEAARGRKEAGESSQVTNNPKVGGRLDVTA